MLAVLGTFRRNPDVTLKLTSLKLKTPKNPDSNDRKIIKNTQ